jgi:hypothetical protein
VGRWGAASLSHCRDRGERGEIFSGNAFNRQVPTRCFAAQAGGGNSAAGKSDACRNIEAQWGVGANVSF